jgi:hypothetical protein
MCPEGDGVVRPAARGGERTRQDKRGPPPSKAWLDAHGLRLDDLGTAHERRQRTGCCRRRSVARRSGRHRFAAQPADRTVRCIPHAVYHTHIHNTKTCLHTPACVCKLAPAASGPRGLSSSPTHTVPQAPSAPDRSILDARAPPPTAMSSWTDPLAGHPRYEAMRVLGRGSHSVVTLCRDRATGEAVAIKLIGRGAAEGAARYPLLDGSRARPSGHLRTRRRSAMQRRARSRNPRPRRAPLLPHPHPSRLGPRADQVRGARAAQPPGAQPQPPPPRRRVQARAPAAARVFCLRKHPAAPPLARG